MTTESEREEYLLGKPIDRQVDALIQEREKEEEAIKTKEGALFMRKGKTSFAKDLAVKIREDPLLAIRQKEEERKQYILNNPFKLKKLRDYIERKDNKVSKHVKTPKLKHQSNPPKPNATQMDTNSKRNYESSAEASPVVKKYKREYKRDVTYFNGGKHAVNTQNNEDLDKKRAEMVETAVERDLDITKRVAKIREKLRKEEALENIRPQRNFTQDLRRDTHKVYDKLDLEMSIRRNRYKVQRNTTDLEEGFKRR